MSKEGDHLMAWDKFDDKTHQSLPCGLCGAEVPDCHPDARGAICWACRPAMQERVREASRRIRDGQRDRAAKARRERGKRAHIPSSVRRDVYARDGHACRHCGSGNDLTLDHIHPWSMGGPDTVDNLQTLCRPCNSSKGARL